MRIPPLRERPDDIELLAQHFLARCLREQGLEPAMLDPAVIAKLKAYRWPGIVRELRNVIKSAVLTSESGTITCANLPAEVSTPGENEAAAPQPADTLVVSIAQGEEALIVNAIAASGGNLTLAAHRLNIAKSTLYAKMQRYGLSREAARSKASH